jgi:hypothetical protein
VLASTSACASTPAAARNARWLFLDFRADFLLSPRCLNCCCSYDFNPGVCARLGSRNELQPADILLWPGDPSAHTGHVVMFVKWIEEGKSYIEAACHE